MRKLAGVGGLGAHSPETARAVKQARSESGHAAGDDSQALPEEVAMKRSMPKPRRDVRQPVRPAPPVETGDPRDARAPLFDDTETPTRPLPAIQPREDPDERDRRRAS
jgi:hypothetical protein